MGPAPGATPCCGFPSRSVLLSSGPGRRAQQDWLGSEVKSNTNPRAHGPAAAGGNSHLAEQLVRALDSGKRAKSSLMTNCRGNYFGEGTFQAPHEQV